MGVWSDASRATLGYHGNGFIASTSTCVELGCELGVFHRGVCPATRGWECRRRCGLGYGLKEMKDRRAAGHTHPLLKRAVKDPHATLEFLSEASGCTAAVTPFILPSHVWAADAKPNSKVGMGFIGMGQAVAGAVGAFLGQDTRVLAVCDVDTTRREEARKRVDDYYAKQQGGPQPMRSLQGFPRAHCPQRYRRCVHCHAPIIGTRFPCWPPCGQGRTYIARSR